MVPVVVKPPLGVTQVRSAQTHACNLLINCATSEAGLTYAGSEVFYTLGLDLKPHRGRCRTVRARCVHGARTVQCFWDGCPTCTPLNGPHRNTPRVLVSAPCSPYWHTRILQF